MQRNPWLPRAALMVAVSLTLGAGEGPQLAPQAGPWRAWLESPGGELPFGLELARRDNGWTAWLINGAERTEVPRVGLEGEVFVLDLEHYDSAIRATLSADGRRLDGTWTQRRGPDRWLRMPFHATAEASPRFKPDTTPEAAGAAQRLDGHWLAKFSQSDEPAVGVFTTAPDGTVTGTFLARSGDYRYLAGCYVGRRLRLSGFDGGHALLFDARLGDDGTLSGDFWSGDSWHETWTARFDPRADLPDGMVRLSAGKPANLSRLVFKDVDGKDRGLADVARGAKVLIVEIFGTWCPNCHDAGAYLTEVDRWYRDQGVAVVGLAFELTGEFAHDAEQVRRFAKRHSIAYPLLIAGQYRKDNVAEVVPLLDRLRAFPTTIFVDASGTVRAVHTGFSGPATGEAYRKQSAEFETLINELLSAHSAPPGSPK